MTTTTLAVIATLPEISHLKPGHTPSRAIEASEGVYTLRPTSPNDGWLTFTDGEPMGNLFGFRRISETQFPDSDGLVSAAGRKFWLNNEIRALILAGRVWVNVHNQGYPVRLVVTEEPINKGAK